MSDSRQVSSRSSAASGRSEGQEKGSGNKARQKRKERQREQVRKLEQKQRERDSSTPVVDEPRDALESLVTPPPGSQPPLPLGGSSSYHHHHQRDKPPEPAGLPEPIDMFADDDDNNPSSVTSRLFGGGRKLMSPSHPVESAQSAGDARVQDLFSLTGGGVDALQGGPGGGNKNVRFDMAGAAPHAISR